MEMTRAAIIDDEPARRRPQDADDRDPDDRDPRRWTCRRCAMHGGAITGRPHPGDSAVTC